MPCKHRFYDKLIPDWQIKYLFIGTFNPEWNGKNNAKYFYGRKQNKFWEIMPKALGLPSQINNIESPDKLELFLKNNMIGITDLISSLQSADECNQYHKKKVLSFKDEELSNFFPTFNTKILELILRNSQTLQKGGVFLTRISNLPRTLGKFWNEIASLCIENHIYCAKLPSPSPRAGKYNISEKIKIWEKIIQNPIIESEKYHV